MWESIFFWIFAVGALASSLAVVLIPKNPIYNALALIVDFFFFAGLYGLLSAHFLAVIQILVYGGAIMVLFMFIIMLLNLRDSEHHRIRINFHQAVGILTAFAFLGLLVGALQHLHQNNLISQNRQAYSSNVEKSQPSKPLPLITPSPIPGLNLDLNEPAINQIYSHRLSSFASHQSRPANGYSYENDTRVYPKFREFDPNSPISIPKQLLDDPDSVDAPRKPASFGTIEPLSVLLVNRFVVPFELTAILLLAAVVGAFIIAKKRL